MDRVLWFSKGFSESSASPSGWERLKLKVPSFISDKTAFLKCHSTCLSPVNLKRWGTYLFVCNGTPGRLPHYFNSHPKWPALDAVYRALEGELLCSLTGLCAHVCQLGELMP